MITFDKFLLPALKDESFLLKIKLIKDGELKEKYRIFSENNYYFLLNGGLVKDAILKKGDEINVYSKNVKFSIISEPFISKTGVYYDALNKNSKFSNLFHFFRGFKTIIIRNFFPEKVEFNNKANKAIYDFYDFYSKTTGEEYRYPRPNDIWLIPVKIEKIN